MLIGRYEHSLDTKGRLTLPADYAGQLAAGVVITRGLEGCIYLFPRAVFESLRERFSSLPFANTRARKLKRQIFPQAHAAMPDRQRRVVIPQWLREHAGITDRVLIAGMDDYVELWAPEAWQAEDEALKAELADEDFFADLNV